MNREIYLICIFFFISCNRSKEQTYFIDNFTKAVGNIKGSSYEGLIKFYTIKDNRLLSETVYHNNIPDGISISYFPNGNISAKENFKDGKLNGTSYFYDTSGKLVSTEFFYYDIRVGPSITYYDNIINTFAFYSLDNNTLMFINYDSLKTQELSEIIKKKYISYSLKEVFNYSDIKPKNMYEYFLYTPEPPGFKFQYSLIIVDTLMKVISTEKMFNHKEPWSTFKIDEKEIDSIKDKRYAIKLSVYDSTKHISYYTTRFL